MNQELIAFLEAHFRDSNQRMEAFHQETTGQIEALRQEMLHRFEKTDQRLDRVEQHLDQVDQRLEKLEDTTRYTLVLVEGLRHEIQLIAEGFMLLSEKLDRLQSEMTLSATQFKEWIEPYYRTLDGRIRALETTSDLRRMDILDAVRVMLGKPPLQPPTPAET